MITCKENGQTGFTCLIYHSLMVLVCLIYRSFSYLLVPVVSLTTIVRNPAPRPRPPPPSVLQQIITLPGTELPLYITRQVYMRSLTIGITPTDLYIALRI